MSSTADIFYFAAGPSAVAPVQPSQHQHPYPPAPSVQNPGFPLRLPQQPLHVAQSSHYRDTLERGGGHELVEEAEEQQQQQLYGQPFGDAVSEASDDCCDGDSDDDSQPGGVPIDPEADAAVPAAHLQHLQGGLTHQSAADEPTPNALMPSLTLSSSESVATVSGFSAAQTESLDSLGLEPWTPQPVQPLEGFPISVHAAQISLGNSHFGLLDEVNTPSVDDYEWKPDICSFLGQWRFAAGSQLFDVGMVGAEASNVRNWERPRSINKEELQGNRYDMQGINWDRLETTRESARDARIKLYQCTRKRPTTTLSANRPYPLPNTENYFSFRRMNTNHKALISHFQLRNLIAATSRNDIFYASRSHVIRTDSVGLACDTVMDLNNDKTSMASIHSAPFDITSMTARDDILIAGGFRGEYALIDLSSPSTTKPHQGFVSHNYNAITNHIHLFPSRTSPHSAPLAAFSSNDASFRLLDTATQTFLRTTTYPAATNCTATSPDSRLRCVVGDFQDVLITDADTGRPFEAIPAHSDHAFACAWADDGILVATGAQDGNVVIHDARRWGRPLATLTSSMACPRSLHWSPVGGGKRVLVVAEADDIVRVVDARGWEKQQCLELFGTVAGVAVGQDGERIWVANADRRFGGIAEFERRGWAGEGEGERERWGFGGEMKGGLRGLRDEHYGFHNRSRGTDDKDDVDMDLDLDLDLDSNTTSTCRPRAPKSKIDWPNGNPIKQHRQALKRNKTRPAEWLAERELDGDPRVRRVGRARRRRGLGLEGLVL